MRQGENSVEVLALEQLGLLLLQPACSGQRVAQGAVAVFAGVVMGLFDMPLGTALQVATHGGGATAHEGGDRLEFEQGLGITLVVVFEMISKDAANGGFHGVRMVLFLFFLYAPNLTRSLSFFHGLFSVALSRREAGLSNACRNQCICSEHSERKMRLR